MNVTLKIHYERVESYDDIEPDVVEEMEVWDDYSGTNISPPIRMLQPDDIEMGSILQESNNIHNHKFYRIDVETDEPVILNIHTNDSPHSADWSKPIERGLRFGSDSRPFSCEIWGEVIMWVERQW